MADSWRGKYTTWVPTYYSSSKLVGDLFPPQCLQQSPPPWHRQLRGVAVKITRYRELFRWGSSWDYFCVLGTYRASIQDGYHRPMPPCCGKAKPCALLSRVATEYLGLLLALILKGPVIDAANILQPL